jgi:ubiquinone/menaquinone biosynthesis C-methylase UbiE
MPDVPFDLANRKVGDEQSCDRSVAVVAQYYNGAAETWDELYGVGRQNPRFARQMQESIKGMFASVPRDAVAVELGAGTGPYLETTALMVRRLIAVDVSEGMLAVCARRVAAGAIANVSLVQDDACELRTIAPGSADMVYSIGLLETVPDLKGLFAAICRILKPNGIVAAITSNGNCPWYSVRRCLEGRESHCRSSRLATRKLLASPLRRSGFTEPEITYWGALPPGIHNPTLGRLMAVVETVVAPTPLARFLGALTMRARKMPTEDQA